MKKFPITKPSITIPVERTFKKVKSLDGLVRHTLGIYRNSRIIRSMINRILIIYLSCIIIVTILSAIILKPMLEQNSIMIAGDANAHMASVVDSTLQSVSAVFQYLSSSNELRTALEQYDHDHTDRSLRNVRLTLNRLISSQPYVRGVILDSSENRFTSIINLTDSDFEYLESSRYKDVFKGNYTQLYTIVNTGDSGSGNITLVYTGSSSINSHRYTFTILYRANAVLENIRQYSESMFSGYQLVNLDNDILYTSGSISSSDPAWYERNAQNMARSSSGLYFSSIIPIGLWRIVSFASNSSISLGYRGYLVATILLFLLLCMLTITLIMPSVYMKMQPLNRLAIAINQGTNNNFSHVPEINSNDEIADLSSKFNQMVDSINLYIGKTLEHEQSENKMKYSLLISQIDPHFIYNTMSIINSLAREKRTEDIVEINTALILILQDRLRVKDIEVFDSVKQEADMVRQYLVIQKYRYNNQVSIVWDIDDAVIAEMIPKNILQPIVENSLFHGLMDEYSGFIEGEITIHIGFSRDGILLQVHDNGRGIPEEVIRQLDYPPDPHSGDRGKRIGIRNIKERLAYLYPTSDCLKIENDYGTTVTINIPICRQLD